MISRRISDIFSEPFRRNIGICLFFGFEFNFGKKKSIIVFVEDIKFDRQAILFRLFFSVATFDRFRFTKL